LLSAGLALLGTSIARLVLENPEAHVSVDPSRPLRPQLEKIEGAIERSLDEVCSSPSVKEINTGELIKIEETLAIVAEAAKEAVSLRRRMRRDKEALSEQREQQQPEA